MNTNTKPNSQPINRIDRDLSVWERMEEKFSKRYGREAFNNRDAVKVRRDIYNQILKQYAFKKRNKEEDIEYRMLKGQTKALNKKLYPNRFVRFARNVVLFAFNVVQFALDVVLFIPKLIIKALFFPPRLNTKSLNAQEKNYAGRDQDKSKEEHGQKQPTNEEQKSQKVADKITGPVLAKGQGQENTTSQKPEAQAVVRKMTNSPIVMSEPSNSKGLHV